MDGNALHDCACGHSEHIDHNCVECGCTIYEPDVDLNVEWHGTENAFRHAPDWGLVEDLAFSA